MAVPVIKIKNLVKTFQLGDLEIEVLKGMNLTVNEGEFVAVMGASGSGKSTLLNIMGCLDIPSSGTYELNNKLIHNLKDDELSYIGNREIGFVFQTFNLLPNYTAVKNVEVPLSYGKMDNRRIIAEKMMGKVGLAGRLHHKPAQLSGGERQRIAIARALSTDPCVVLADEPTGNLDSRSGEEVMKLFVEFNQEGKTIVMVTHSQEIAQCAQRIIHVKDGVIINEHC